MGFRVCNRHVTHSSWRQASGRLRGFSRGSQLRFCKPPDDKARIEEPEREVREVREAIQNAGTRLLFMPPYSRDLNPIKQVFSKPKHRIRKAPSRCSDKLWWNVGDILKTFKSGECANYLSKAEYAQAGRIPTGNPVVTLFSRYNVIRSFRVPITNLAQEAVAKKLVRIP